MPTRTQVRTCAVTGDVGGRGSRAVQRGSAPLDPDSARERGEVGSGQHDEIISVVVTEIVRNVGE
jgi:hypothetical protein